MEKVDSPLNGLLKYRRRLLPNALLHLSTFLPLYLSTLLPCFAFETVKFYSPRSGRVVDVVEGEVLVVFREGTSSLKKESINRAMGVRKISDDTEGVFFQRIKITEGETLESVLQKYRADPSVKYAGPNYIFRKAAIVNDPLFTTSPADTHMQWGLAKINAPGAWALSTGTGVIVAVLDTGIDATHPEFSEQTVPSEFWRNFITTTSVLSDDCGHGTHVSGIIAARSNGAFVVGVATNSKILPLKILDFNPLQKITLGTSESVARGIIYASTVTISGSAVRIINLSLGSEGRCEIINRAVQYAFNRGICIIAASGNYGDSKVVYPAGLNNVLAVGSSTPNDTRSLFSNYGSNLDLVAPGGIGGGGPGDIISTWPLLLGSTRYVAGTSMATPFVSGVAALILSANPKLIPSDVYDILRDTSDDIASPGRDNFTGYGRLNAHKAVRASVGVPPASAKTYSYPNPFHISERPSVRFFIPEGLGADNLKVRIYSFSGDPIKTLTDMSWDGRDDNGDYVATGLYFFAVETSKGKSTGKLTVIR